MSGVTAGVISIDSDRTVQLVNSSAVALLDSGGGDPVGRPLAVLSAELDALLESDTREAVIQEIGRASCRERVCQYVSISVVAVPLKKKKNNIDIIYFLTIHVIL